MTLIYIFPLEPHLNSSCNIWISSELFKQMFSTIASVSFGVITNFMLASTCTCQKNDDFIMVSITSTSLHSMGFFISLS